MFLFPRSRYDTTFIFFHYLPLSFKLIIFNFIYRLVHVYKYHIQFLMASPVPCSHKQMLKRWVFSSIIIHDILSLYLIRSFLLSAFCTNIYIYTSILFCKQCNFCSLLCFFHYIFFWNATIDLKISSFLIQCFGFRWLINMTSNVLICW